MNTGFLSDITQCKFVKGVAISGKMSYEKRGQTTCILILVIAEVSGVSFRDRKVSSDPRRPQPASLPCLPLLSACAVASERVHGVAAASTGSLPLPGGEVS